MSAACAVSPTASLLHSFAYLCVSVMHAHCCKSLQGRVACEINSGDELASTELIFGGVLTQLTPEEAVAVLSALVFQVCLSSECWMLKIYGTDDVMHVQFIANCRCLQYEMLSALSQICCNHCCYAAGIFI